MMGVKIAVRMDDITPDMNWENFDFFRNLFRETGITPLLGIVPDNRDPQLSCGAKREDFCEVMRGLKDEGYRFAMHGYQHIYTTKNGGIFPLNNFSEFAKIPYDKQKEMLMLGREKLQRFGIDTDIFMAPAHSYDKNTIKALKEVGFTKITDGFGKVPYIDRGIIFYPISFQLSRSLKRKDGATTIVIHANTITEAEKERLVRIFKEHGKNMISYSDYLRMKPVTRSVFGRILEYMLAKFKFILVRVGQKRKRKI